MLNCLVILDVFIILIIFNLFNVTSFYVFFSPSSIENGTHVSSTSLSIGIKCENLDLAHETQYSLKELYTLSGHRTTWDTEVWNNL